MAAEAEVLGLAPRTWPPTVLAHAHWQTDYRAAGTTVGLALALDEAVADLHNWITKIDRATLH